MTTPSTESFDAGKLAFDIRPSDGMLYEPTPEYGPPEYGPDPSASQKFAENPRVEEQSQKRKANKGLFQNLGNNKKRGTGPRALVKKDVEKIAGLYQGAGMMVIPFRPDAGKLMVENADHCADCWREVCETNDSARRFILGMIEGGTWGKLIMAHLPIVIALLPDGVLPIPRPNNATSDEDMRNAVGAFFQGMANADQEANE